MKKLLKLFVLLFIIAGFVWTVILFTTDIRFLPCSMAIEHHFALSLFYINILIYLTVVNNAKVRILDKKLRSAKNQLDLITSQRNTIEYRLEKVKDENSDFRVMIGHLNKELDFKKNINEVYQAELSKLGREIIARKGNYTRLKKKYDKLLTGQKALIDSCKTENYTIEPKNMIKGEYYYSCEQYDSGKWECIFKYGGEPIIDNCSIDKINYIRKKSFSRYFFRNNGSPCVYDKTTKLQKANPDQIKLFKQLMK